LIGKTISHYKILAKIGEGGMGVVYKAGDTRLDRIVALKFLPAHLTANDTDKARFIQEAKAAAAINHPNVCTIYDIEEHDSQQFIVMEYVEGQTLRDKIKDERLKINDAIDYATQIADALKAAHAKDIIHRDIKSENIMVTSTGQVKVMDFGLAKLRGSVKLTKTSTTAGTLSYSSPEQIQGKEADARSDIFSFGIVLYEMLTRQLPFKGEYESALIYSILDEEPEPVQNKRPDISSELQQVVNRTMQKDPDKRYQTITDVLTELKSIQRQEESEKKRSQSSRMTRTGSTRKKVILWGGLCILFGVLAILFYLFKLSKPNDVQNKSIAVLPFQNLSDSKEDEYFSDGITEDILTQLSKISDLNVISGTTIMQYKNTKKSIREIGKELKAGVILEGSIRHSNDRIRISSQLIDAREDRHLWAETYDREMKDVFAIQSDVAKNIAAAMRTELSPTEREPIERIYTENTGAYQLYLKGRFYWNKRTAPDLQKTIDYFNQAIEKDPKYALAYQGLADSYFLLPQHGLAAWENFNKAL
jgi:serine/threonine protein kinase